ncbi:NIL domain protein [Desulfonatronospira thiodismutans ASO3-1]|uniref:NIL domain protein n=1 Tax=Desulfonatronospira thiodismutans ASO3-1 TaxID=555779 RepID=D6SPF7_9BACT|nr:MULTISPECIES: NIL domain-containing protein [Desulfonatronospira]EFI34633.1 NIL domain protein [Desulfonatronospira thiodismutans ASO3-1]RQD76805.1 MAG: 4Fe-4S dicluster domain-containing protein [Desulfonatronospira sp. MSAO_Bac3]
MQTAEEFSKIISLHFSPEVVRKPMMYNLAKKFDLTFNILKAKISPREEGHMILELSGDLEDYKKGVSYLQEHGISIRDVAQSMTRDESLCTHCGVCTALCFNRALRLDKATRKILFDEDKCTACSNCTRICPVGAMQVESNGDF